MKNNKLPEMKSLNSLISPKTEELTESDSSILGDILDYPEHKPIFETVEQKSNSIKEIKVSSSGIEVVALRNGFYNLHRLREGDQFTIKKFEDLGEWMKCVDPDLQKKHLENIKIKKATK